MATYYLRPSADVSIEHSCSTGSSAYALINEATPDDDSKYIYYEDSGSSSSGTTYTKTSSFTATGTIPSGYTLSSAKVVIRAKRGGSSSSDSAISGSVGSSSLSSTSLSTSYVNYEATVAVSNLTRSGNTVSCTVSATTALKVYKDETGNVRITQIFIQVEAAAPSYTITTSASGPGTISSSQTVQQGGSCTITITPTTASGGLLNKVMDGSTDVTSQLVKQSGYYTYTLTNVQANHAIAATFKYYMAYIKQSGSWVQKPIYQKRNGSWVRLTEAPTGYANGDKIKTPDYLCFTANTAGSTVELCAQGGPTCISGAAYSRDGLSWTSFTPATTTGVNVITLANVGDKVYFKNNITGDFERDRRLNFDMSGSISASGNVNSIYDADNFESLTELTHAYCYASLFKACTSLTSAPKLPTTTLASSAFSCYEYMFSDCTNLTTPPALPATTLSEQCYYNMFVRSGITVAPELPAPVLTPNCYNEMFLSCENLVTAPASIATTLATSCCRGMFQYCRNLVNAPNLPATVLANSCYEFMFFSCNSLTKAPKLPATTLAYQCYYSMFVGCTSLTEAPELPATTLAYACYCNMFTSCSNLTTVPILPATTLTEYCYYSMFSDCTALQVSDAQTEPAPYAWRIPTADIFNNTYVQTNMFINCAAVRSSDTMLGAEGQSYTYYTQNKPITSENYELCFYAQEANSTVELYKVGSPSISDTAYSRDGSTWTTFSPSDTIGAITITLANIGDKVYFRNNITGDLSRENYIRFTMSGSVSASGNINSMYSATNFRNLTELTYERCFYSLFMDCTALTTAPVLPATTMSYSCYEALFQNCSQLRAAPNLPATTLAEQCYYNLFTNCVRLTAAPVLPATTLAVGCYHTMFNNCSSLTVAPRLPATTLVKKCYHYTFLNCTGLTTIPDLPATTLAENCYEDMFENCTSLQISDTQTEAAPYAWKVPADGTFANTFAQEGMFTKCAGTRASDNMAGAQGNSYTYYTQNKPTGVVANYLYFVASTAGSTVELCKVGSPSISSTAYSLDGHSWVNFTPSETAGTNVITLTNAGDKVYFRNNITGNFSRDNHLQFILSGQVAASGNCNSLYVAENFDKLTTLTYTFCFASLFMNCSSLLAPPTLPATTLSDNCYEFMFDGCTEMVIAPALPATNLAAQCYYQMLSSCVRIVKAPILPATTLAYACYCGMFEEDSDLVIIPELPATTLAQYCYYGMFHGCTALQVSDTQTAEASYVWTMPTSGTFTNTYAQDSMFLNCLGTRSSDNMPGQTGQSYTYYTQNKPES